MESRNIMFVIATILCMGTLTAALYQVSITEDREYNGNEIYTLEFEEVGKPDPFLHLKPAISHYNEVPLIDDGENSDNGIYTLEFEEVKVGKPEPFHHMEPPVSHYHEPETQESKTLKVASDQISVSWPDPPPHDEVAKTARYVMHISDWAAMATTSVHKSIEGFPFANVFSVSDGPVGNSTGIPYLYLTPMELSVHDLKQDNRASLTMSEAQSSYCHEKGFDPEDPRCAHIIFTGRIEKIEDGTEEAEFAKEALFSRHPEMPDWPTGHEFYFAKLNIIHIYVLDFFGGAKVVEVDDYFKADPFS